MKRWTLSLLCSVAAFTGGCAPSDVGITTSVKTQLAADGTVKAQEISVATKGRVVTLTGTVQTPEAEAQALNIARRTNGVADVVDQLTVAPTAEQPAGTSGRVGEIPGASDSAGLDPRLTTAVQSRLLADPTVGALKISVDTRDRVVTLTGMVDSTAARDRALDIARSVENIARVEDKLTIGHERR
jgi:hyperosmotically inducible protein